VITTNYGIVDYYNVDTKMITTIFTSKILRKIINEIINKEYTAWLSTRWYCLGGIW